MKNDLHNEMSFIDYLHVVTKFFVLNDKNISKIRKNQSEKFYNLFLNNSHHNSITFHNPEKVIFNFPDHVLNTTEKSLLSNGLNFAIPPKKNYADFMLPFELLYRDVDSLEVSNLDKNLLKVGSEILPFHHTRILVKVLRRTYPKRNLMH